MDRKLPVIIWGATGFTGGELLRIIARHPHMVLAGAVSRSKAGTPVGAVHPHLRFAYQDVNFISPEEGADLDAELVFLALPHKAAAETAKKRLSEGRRVVDLSADFRLRDHQEYKRWYETEHPCPELLEGSVYGLPELHRAEMAGAKIISGVGCNATSAIFALLPLAKAGLIENARIECRVGSSEGGAEAKEGSSHSLRSRSLRVVSPFVHRHMAEVVQELGLSEANISMTVTAVELVRGIQCIAHVTMGQKLKEADIWKLYRSQWSGEPFVSVSPAKPAHFRIPDPRFVMGSNRVLTGFALAEDGRRAIAASAIDNLLKGAAGSAVQSANIMMGIEEVAGLEMMPLYPA